MATNKHNEEMVGKQLQKSFNKNQKNENFFGLLKRLKKM